MKTFTMIRESDESGVSGTGRILDGVVFHNGKVVICWRTDIEGSKHGVSSLGIYDSWEDFSFIHIDSHPANQSRVVWGDDIADLESSKKKLSIRNVVYRFLQLPNYAQRNLLRSLDLIDKDVYMIGMATAKKAFAKARERDKIDLLIQTISGFDSKLGT